MSQLQQLTTAMHSVAQQSQQTAGNIEAFDAKFSQSIAEVESLIGGATSQADKQIIEVLQAASSAVKAAAAALNQASQVARNWADSTAT